MNSKLLSDFTKPTIISGQQYGTKISVEIDHSDTDIDELFDAFRTLVIGLGYSDTTWKECIIERAEEYNEESDKKSWNDYFDGIGKGDNEILQSQKDAETFFNAITNPPYPTKEAIKGVQDFLDELDGLSENQIDEALAEHNEDEWNDDMEQRYWENEGNEHMPPELEEQFWNEQPPEPFATPEEVEKYGIDDKFDDYGKRIVKTTKKVGRRGIKKK